MKKQTVKLPKRLDYNENLETLISLNKNNREALEKSENAGCYYCTNIFEAKEITEWCDKEQTAICPRCSIDSVLPDSKVILTKKFLREMYEYWFTDGMSFKFKDGKVVDIVDTGNKYDKAEFEKYKKNQLEAMSRK